MNRPIRRVGYAVTVLILLLVAQLTYLQVVDADNLAHNPKNVRGALKEYNRARGAILTADGQIVAQSLPTTGDFKYVRFYPQGGLYYKLFGGDFGGHPKPYTFTIRVTNTRHPITAGATRFAFPAFPRGPCSPLSWAA